MEIPKVNLAENTEPLIVRPRRRWRRWVIAGIFLIGAWAVFSSPAMPASGVQAYSPLALISRVGRYVIHGGGLKGEFSDRVNILILGMGGEGHDGPYLTDTIMLASIRPSTGEAGLISIPRDLGIPNPAGGIQKINTVNAFAEADRKGSGGEVASRAVSELLDQPVPYFVRVDFRAFKELIDEVGGVSISVDRAFADASFPAGETGEYRTVAFSAGPQIMDGARALDYARSRMGSNGEGSDFARSRRQQKVLLALKQKLFSTDTLLDPSRIAKILGTLDRHLTTNLSTSDIIRFIELGRRVRTDTIRHAVLDDRPGGELKAAVVDGSFFLIPTEGTFNRIREVARNLFTAEPIVAAAETPLVRIEVQNGTMVTGLAARAAEKLRAAGFAVVSYGNAAERTHASTTLFVIAENKKEERARLAKLLNARIETGAPSGYAEAARSLDFIVVLGTDAANI